LKVEIPRDLFEVENPGDGTLTFRPRRKPLKVEFRGDGKLYINGLDISLSPSRAASIYHQLFTLYLTAIGREIRIAEATNEALDEAEKILENAKEK